MPDIQVSDRRASAPASVGAVDAVIRLRQLAPGDAATWIGLDGDALLAAASGGDLGARRLLLIAAGDTGSVEAILARILDDLADLAAARWPDWPDPMPPRVPGPWRRAANAVFPG